MSTDNIAEKYTICASSAVNYASAWLVPGPTGNEDLRVIAYRSVRNVDTDAAETYVQCHLVQPSSSNITPITPPFQVSKAAIACPSRSGKIFRVLNLQKDSKDVPMLEILDAQGSLSMRIDASEIHGKICGDDWFGGCDWSRDERFVVYMAEPKKPKTTTFFDKPQNGNTSDQAVTPSSNKYDYIDDWGEKYTGIITLVLCICDTATGRVDVVKGVAADVTPGQPVFTPGGLGQAGGLGVVYTAWRHNPRKLGMIYCYHRPCGLFHVDVSYLTQGEGAAQPENPPHRYLTPDVNVARCARFTPRGDELIYLAANGLETHNGCMQLRALPFPSLEGARVIVDVVGYPDEANGFPGLYTGTLLSRCFIDDVTCVINTAWKSRTAPVLVNLSTGVVTRVTETCELLRETDGGDGWNSANDSSVSALDVCHGHMLFAASTPSRPARLGVLSLNSGTPRVARGSAPTSMAVSTKMVTQGIRDEVTQALSGIRWKIVEVTPEDDPRATFEAILLLPPASSTEGASLPPLVLTPHGGPHSGSTTAYFHTYAFMAISGYAVLHVNYRGSIGFGQKPLSSLAGKIGTQDAHDLDLALQEVARLQVCDMARVGVFGGSHGGFLTAHMIAQFPDRFNVAAMRNPALNLPVMATISDIPDWTVVESHGLGVYDFSRFIYPTSEQLQRMLEVSPTSLITNVKTPTLICVGAKDRRVPYSQGIEYYHVLRGQGVPTRLVVYPEDDHALDKPATEADAWIQITLWLNQYM